jgi:hypothetical protein
VALFVDQHEFAVGPVARQPPEEVDRVAEV